MALLKDFALKIIRDEIGATFEDKIEAYQFISDNFYLEELNSAQHAEFNFLVEGDQIDTPPWRNWEV